MTLVPEDTMRWMVELVQDSLDFYRYAQRRAATPDARQLFGVAARLRVALLDDLHASGVTLPAPCPPPDDFVHSYAPLRAAFDPADPGALISGLRQRDEALLRLMQSVCRVESRRPVLDVMRSYRARIEHSGRGLSRLVVARSTARGEPQPPAGRARWAWAR